MASMLAAQKLYPHAVVVFPGSQERNLRNFFIKSMVYLFNMTDLKNLDFNAVRQLILVDTRQRSRIGKLADILGNENLVVHVYDHHPPTEQDIQGDFELNELTGANTTLLVELIRRRKIHITPDEATIMCLGIYEDTGSFTYH